MSEKYMLIKHNENLAEIVNDRGVGLLFLVDEDCERKLGIIVDLLNEQQATISALKEENEQLKQQSSEKQEHITHLESKIHRMREQIHKLEKLYHYRSADIKRENEQLSKEHQEMLEKYLLLRLKIGEVLNDE